MIKIRMGFAVIMAAAILASGAARAEETPLIETRVACVAMFKNGYAFIEREAELPAGTKTFTIAAPPEATLGSLWFGSAKGARVASLRSVERAEETRTDILNLAALIRANPGAHAKIRAGGEIFEGELWIPAPPEADDLPDPMSPAAIRYSNSHLTNRPSIVRPSVASYCVLRTGDGSSVALDLSDIKRIEFLGDYVNAETTKKAETVIECKLAEPAGKGEKILIHYLASGMSWLPAYEIGLVSGDKARLRWQATLINDIEDLDNVEVRCIVGYPNFQYKYLSDPLSSGQNLADFLRELFKGERSSSSRYDNGSIAQQALFSHNIAEFAPSAPAMPEVPEDGDWNEDLFYLPPITVTMKRGDRATFMLAEEDVEYRHLYTWNVSDTIPVNDRGYYDNNGNSHAEKPAIWHEIELINQGKRPWTTGPAMVVRDAMPLSQDTLNYTSSGGRTTVRITRATDVSGQAREYEKNRQAGAKRIYGSQYDLVNVRGELSLRNNRREPVEVRVTKTTTGTISSSEPGAKVEVRAEGLRPVNQISTLIWNVDLEPGDETKLIYNAGIYVRN